MTEDLRWAARYAFCEDLWRDRARIVWDRQLESVLLARAEAGSNGEASDDPVTEMLQRLLPSSAQQGDRRRIDVSMGVNADAVGRRLAPWRPGTQFLTLGPLCDALRRRTWEVAFADLSDLLVTDGPGEPSRLAVRGVELVEALAADFAGGGRTVVLSVAAEVEAPTPALRGDTELQFGVDYAGLAEIVAPLVEDGTPVRIYGVLRPTMAAVVELGDAEEDEYETEGAEAEGQSDALGAERREPSEDDTQDVGPATGPRSLVAPAIGGGLADFDDDMATAIHPSGGARAGSGAWRDGKPRGARWSTTAGAASEVADESPDERPDGPPSGGLLEEEDVPLAYDNTLGTQEPAIVEYIAVIGSAATARSPEGMTLVELPSPAEPTVVPSGPAPASLRAQLAQSQRQADLAAIDRQSLLERLDDLESTNTALKAEAAQLRDGLARALAEIPESTPAVDPDPGDAAARFDAMAGEVQTLRWELAQTKHLLDTARARPVETLEAEVARLQALWDAGVALPIESASTPATDSDPAQGVNGRFGGTGEALPREPHVETGPIGGVAALAAWPPLVATLDALLRRVERSDISALELRKRLVGVRDALIRLGRRAAQ